MALNFQNLAKQLPLWFRRGGDEGDVVMGVMGRLVRNLPGHTFPGWSTAEGRKAVADILLPSILEQQGFKTAWHAEMPELSYGVRRALLERRQISPCLAARCEGCHLIINRSQDTVVMLNEEEHLVIHSFAEGLDFDTLFTRMQRLPEGLSRSLSFAHSTSRGYLTSLPGEAGEGIQLYVVLHLPALTLSNMMPQVGRGIEKLQLNMSPFYPNLGEECGNSCVLYTHPVPTGALQEVREHLEDVVDTLVTREHQVRLQLLELSRKGDVFVEDRICRSYGLLSYARAISAAEWADALSLLRLGVWFGYISAEDAQPEELLAELAQLAITGGEFCDGQEQSERAHPRAATAAEQARATAIRHFLNHTTLPAHTAAR